LIIAVAVAGKFLGAFGAAKLHKVPTQRATAIGLLMNTRGLTEIIILTVGRQKGLLDTRLFSMLVLMAVVTTVMTGPLLQLAYSDRRLARDIAEAERGRLGPAAYRVLVAVPDHEDPQRLVAVATDLAAGQNSAEVVIVLIQPLPSTVLEVGSGLGAELGDVAAAAERMEQLRRQVERPGVSAVTLMRMSSDPAAEVTAMSASVAADAVVTDADLRAQLADSLTCPVIAVRPSPTADRSGPVRLVMSSGMHGDAAAEVALRLALTRDVAIVVQAADASTRRRAGAFASALSRVGVRTDESTIDSAETVSAYGQEVEGATIEASAELDRDPVDVAKLVARIRGEGARA
jgi:hypothetical protein